MNIEKILAEIKEEQQISPFLSNSSLENYINEGIYDIDQSAGALIDYDEDLKARSLLKNYVLYANYKRLAEFKELYHSEYAALQAKYYRNTNVS